MKKERMQIFIIVLTFIFFTSYSIEKYVYLESAGASCFTKKDYEFFREKVPDEKKNDDKRRSIDAEEDSEDATNKSDGAGKLPPKMIFIKGGCFQMGSPDDDGLNYDDKKPIHKICLDDYYIGEHEVTQGQWKSIMGTEPPIFYKYCEDFPVSEVSWNDVQLFIEKLNKVTSKTYRLPTEAEWEYAARARGLPQKYAGTSNKSDLGEYAWFWDNSNARPRTVKSKKSNSIGLYDMSGNVSEWVHDWYDGHYYSISPIHNPTGPDSGSRRVIRGGAWGMPLLWFRTFDRDEARPDKKLVDTGFRLAISAKK